MIISLETAKNFMNDTSNANDSTITALIKAAEEIINGMINQNIMIKTVTYRFTGNNSDRYVIPRFPVNSITSLKYRNNPSETWETLTVNTDYFVTADEKLTEIYYSVGFYSNVEYQIVMSTGYATAPDDVRLVAMQMVKVFFDETPKGDDRLAVTSVSEAQQMMTVNKVYKDLAPAWQRLLSPYTIPVQ